MKFVRTIVVLVALAITVLFAWQANSPAFAKGPVSPTGTVPSCQGTNLLEQLKTQDAATYQALINRENAVPNGKGLLWKIERNGTPASYIYGTMHVSDERLTTLPGPVMETLKGARTVALELDEIVDDQKMQQAVVKNIGLIAFTDGRTLETVLSKNQLGRLKNTLKNFNMPFATSRGMKPWFVMLSLALPLCEIKRQKAGLKAVDGIIAKTAQQNGARLVGLETVREQFSAFDRMSIDDQKHFLMNSLRMMDMLDDQIETMAQLYLQRRTAALWEFATYLTKKSMMAQGRGAAQLQKELVALNHFQTELIIKRNKVMARRALPLLKKGKVFIAVGALHLPGKTGLVTLLQNAGYKMSAVY
ncbi:MAG: TraB/GumN family protein [bacterium]|nr:TraB/GumN family protein [bacterium]